MSISTFKRYEVKYLCDAGRAQRLIERLMPHMRLDGHCPEGKSYSIYSIYFDTPDSALIRHSMSDPYYKEKLRVRSYEAPRSGEDTVFLEMKKKIGGVISKRRAAMPLSQAEDFICKGIKPAAAGYMDSQVIDEVSYFLSCNKVVPAVYISYSRLALCGTEDRELRVTFDTDIVARRYDVAFGISDRGDRLLKDSQVLIEVKFSSSVPTWLAESLSELNIYRKKYSKYGKEYERTCLYSAGGVKRVPVPAAARHVNLTAQRHAPGRSRSI